MPDLCYVVLSDSLDYAIYFLNIDNALSFVKDELKLGYLCQIMEVRKGE